MKKLSLALIILAMALATSPARADWSSDLQKAISTGDYNEINVIAAQNPNNQGGIALALLTAAQTDINSNPDASVKLFSAATPFTTSLSLAQASQAKASILAMLGLADNTGFRKKDPHGASEIYTAALAMSSEGNVAVVDPKLHDVAAADAGDFMSQYAENDKDLRNQINLALQIGAPPPIGPHGVLTPSPE